MVEGGGPYTHTVRRTESVPIYTHGTTHSGTYTGVTYTRMAGRAELLTWSNHVSPGEKFKSGKTCYR